MTDNAALEMIRIGFGCDTTENDIRYTIKVFKKIFNEKSLNVNLVMPSQLNESLLLDKQTYIIDVRPQFLRKKLKGFPD